MTNVSKNAMLNRAKKLPMKVEMNENFICEWEQNECLWNAKHPAYHNRDERLAAKETIAEKLGMCVADVETKMNSLRTYYTKELSRVTTHLQAVENGVRLSKDELNQLTKWPHFGSMDFLREYITTRKSSLIVNLLDFPKMAHKVPWQPQALDSDRQKISAPAKNEVVNDTNETNNDISDDHSDHLELESVVQHCENASVRVTLPSIIRPVKRPISREAERLKKPKTFRENNTFTNSVDQHEYKSNDEEDAQDVFGRHVAHQLRDMETDAMREYTKLQIQQVLYNVRFGHMSRVLPQQRNGVFTSDTDAKCWCPTCTTPNNMSASPISPINNRQPSLPSDVDTEENDNDHY